MENTLTQRSVLRLMEHVPANATQGRIFVDMGGNWGLTARLIAMQRSSLSCMLVVTHGTYHPTHALEFGLVNKTDGAPSGSPVAVFGVESFDFNFKFCSPASVVYLSVDDDTAFEIWDRELLPSDTVEYVITTCSRIGETAASQGGVLGVVRVPRCVWTRDGGLVTCFVISLDRPASQNSKGTLQAFTSLFADHTGNEMAQLNAQVRDKLLMAVKTEVMNQIAGDMDTALCEQFLELIRPMVLARVPGDGNCLVSCALHSGRPKWKPSKSDIMRFRRQLQDKLPDVITRTFEENSSKQLICPDELAIANPRTGVMESFLPPDADTEDYIEAVGIDRVFLTRCEVAAISSILQRVVWVAVFDDSGCLNSVNVFGNDRVYTSAPLLLRLSGNHYDVYIPADVGGESDEDDSTLAFQAFVDDAETRVVTGPNSGSCAIYAVLQAMAGGDCKPNASDMNDVRQRVADYVELHGSFDADAELSLSYENLSVWKGGRFIPCLTEQCTIKEYVQVLRHDIVYFSAVELDAMAHVLNVSIELGICDDRLPGYSCIGIAHFNAEVDSLPTVRLVLYKSHFAAVISNLRVTQLRYVNKLLSKYASPPATGGGTFNQLTDAGLKKIAGTFEKGKVFLELGGGIGKSLLCVGLLSDCTLGFSLELHKDRWRQSVRVVEELAAEEKDVPVFLPGLGNAAKCSVFSPAQNVLFYSLTWHIDDINTALVSLNASSSVQVLVTDACKTTVAALCPRSYFKETLGSINMSCTTNTRVFRVFGFSEQDADRTNDSMEDLQTVFEEAVADEEDEMLRVFMHEMTGQAAQHHMTKLFSAFLKTGRPPLTRRLRRASAALMYPKTLQFVNENQFSALTGLPRRMAFQAHEFDIGGDFEKAFQYFIPPGLSVDDVLGETKLWLSDDNFHLILRFCKAFPDRNPRFTALSPQQAKKMVEAVSASVYVDDIFSTGRYKWLRRKSIVYVPFNKAGIHWVVFVLDLARSSIVFL
jgi:hypothetical protein